MAFIYVPVSVIFMDHFIEGFQRELEKHFRKEARKILRYEISYKFASQTAIFGGYPFHCVCNMT